jgi:hypothetical protein
MQVLRWHVARLHDGEGFESWSQKGPLGSDQLVNGGRATATY